MKKVGHEDPKYFLVLRSLVKDHSVIAKVVITKARRLKSASFEDEAKELWRKLVRNLPIETIEALEKLLKRRLDELYLAKDQVSAKKLQKPIRRYTCPDCGDITDGGKHGTCDTVLGRRGWRKLGEYDG